MRYGLKYVWSSLPQNQVAYSHYSDWYPTPSSRDVGGPPFLPNRDGTFASYLEADQWVKWKLSSIVERHETERRVNGRMFYYLIEELPNAV